MNKLKKSAILLALLCVLPTFPSAAGTGLASNSNADDMAATASNADFSQIKMIGDSIWTGYLDGSVGSLSGEGTKNDPYLLTSAEDLKFLAYQVANEDVDGYSGCYFRLVKDISLSGNSSWLPIGYFDSTGGQLKPFCGAFDGNGYTINNLSISDTSQNYAGLFGSVEGAVIQDLKVSGTIGAKNIAGLIAGSAYDSIITGCTSSGQVRAAGVLGGICGEIYDSTVYACVNRALVLGGSLGTGIQSAAGGICGAAHNAILHSCTQEAETGGTGIAGVSSEGVTGGLVGSLNNSELYNSIVTGKVGSMSSEAMGGLVGEMTGGRLMINRFAGTLAVSVSGVIPDAGLFIGRTGSSVSLGENLKYLYTDSEDKFYINPFGSRLNGLIRPEHHIGVYYSNNSYSLYSPVSSPKFQLQDNYFYEELEAGVLEIENRDLDHWAPAKNGKPVRGFLVTVPDIPHGTLSAIELQNVYAKEITAANPGAVALGNVVSVSTSPIHKTEQPPVYYELKEGSLKWYAADSTADEEIKAGAFGYAFTMPEKHIILDAVYQAMTNGVVLDRNELTMNIKQVRSGSRWNPAISWQIDPQIQLIPTIVPDEVINKIVTWKIVGEDGRTTDAASVDAKGTVKISQDAVWIQEIIKNAVAEQNAKPYINIPSAEQTVICKAVVTTEAGGKQAECMIQVIFSIEDKTYVPVTGIGLNYKNLECRITKTLSGPRKAPKTEYTVSELPQLTVDITPAYADNKDVVWYSDSPDLITVKDGILSIHEAEQIKWLPEETEKTVQITAVTEDGGLQTGCEIKITLETIDKTTSGSSGGGGGSSSGGSSSGKGSSKNSSASIDPGNEREHIYSGTWVEVGDKWQLVLPEGEHAKNQWAYLEGKWYYFDGEGVMQTGWKWVSEKWFYMWPNGTMATGWILQDGRWYLLNHNGEMQTGWQQVADKWYYMLPDGSMAANTATPDGYYVDTFGVWVTN